MSEGWRSSTYWRLSAKLETVLGAKTAKAFDALNVKTVGDLMRHVPRRYFAGTELSDLAALRPGEEVAVFAKVAEARVVGGGGGSGGRGGQWRGGPKSRLEARITDGRGSLALAFFGAANLVAYWRDQLLNGDRGIFVGKVREFNGRLQLAHPDFVMLDADGRIVGGAQRNADIAEATRAPLVGLYPASSKLRTWTISQCAGLVLEHLSGLADPLPEWLREAEGVVELETALRWVHRPQTMLEARRGLDRLRFDEAFALQLTMASRRADAATRGAVPRRPVADGLLAAFDDRLPFELTDGQRAVSDTILEELAQPHPMQRLLQGEVGSGKTVVALRAMLTVVDAGGQAALLAPTEVLATQHFQTVVRLLGDLAAGGLFTGDGPGTGVVLLTGSLSAANRRVALERIATGEAGLVIGTHALLGETVRFADLGLVVVDEQHRFGVEQRAALGAKAAGRPHLLVMTATPIPRSVAMTVFGDLAVSTLTEIPRGRAEVATIVVDGKRNPGWVERAWRRMVEEVLDGRQAYVVCARISSATDEQRQSRPPASGSGDAEAAEAEPATAAEDLFAELSTGPLASLRVALLHGQLPADEKDQVMGRFAAGETDVLVATTVIEVGVDVPNAAMMVICDADRFGISQLHQLRGRIGRGEHPGTCLLLTGAPPGTAARERIDAVAGTRDGFLLAELDLEQRREGDVLGAVQAGGKSSLRLLRVIADSDLIQRARTLAERCLTDDPQLVDPGLWDIVEQVERTAQGEWLERT